LVGEVKLGPSTLGPTGSKAAGDAGHVVAAEKTAPMAHPAEGGGQRLHGSRSSSVVTDSCPGSESGRSLRLNRLDWARDNFCPGSGRVAGRRSWRGHGGRQLLCRGSDK
jgi:hypothetical protein